MKITTHLKSRGFSLIEMAIVLVILGLVLGAVLSTVGIQREQLARSETERVLEVAKKSLLGFAQANGRLPCPATAASNGLEDPLGGGVCTAQLGFLPAATLGIQPVNSNGVAIDAWNNPIQYAVTQTNAGGAASADFTTSGDLSTIGIAGGLNPDLKVCSASTNCSATVYLADNAVAVIFSTGKNFGLSAGVDETSNMAATTTFYSRTTTAATAAPSMEFDDMVTWISPFVLYNAMIETGQLH
jgi:prepilin-type N-terminal cleavage/methylation domain-containing protein